MLTQLLTEIQKLKKAILVPILSEHQKEQILAIQDLVLSETNVKVLELLDGNQTMIKKKAKANFKVLGKKAGALLKDLSQAITNFTQADLTTLEQQKHITLDLNGTPFELSLEDVEVVTEDIEGLLVNSNNDVTVALDITLTPELKEEGIARDFINRIQNLRKDKGFEVTDKITIRVAEHPALTTALLKHQSYIQNEVLADELTFGTVQNGDRLELEEGVTVEVMIN